MATETLIDETDLQTSAEPSPSASLRTETNEFFDELKKILEPMASLKISVAMFGLGIFLVLVGTLAQTEKDIWEVMAQYFRCWFAWVEFRVFAPPAWFPTIEDRNAIGIPFPTGTIQGFWFPGGWIIGGVMVLNLLAAHTIRFKVRAKGSQLVLGSTLTFVGLALTTLVITTGSGMNGVMETASSDWTFVWNIFVGCVGAIAAACLVRAGLVAEKRKVEFWLLGTIGLIFGGITAWLLVSGDSVRIDPSGMRILWQLIKATGAGLVLLVGCMLLFDKRAGIVLLHAGVLLLMLNEINVASQHIETQMTINEGQTSNFTQDTRTVELAVIDRSGEDNDTEIVIPKEMLKRSAKNEQKISDPRLPFDLKVVDFQQNSQIEKATGDEKNPATKGQGLHVISKSIAPTTGTDSGGRVDETSIYVELFKKGTDESMGVYLFPLLFGLQDLFDKVEVGDKKFDIALRFKRYYKSYKITLNDIQKNDYVGTNTPRDYSSYVKLVDKSRNVDREVRIWMNNPLRFAGETFYQSGYDSGIVKGRKIRPESTTLQVVSNEGWMIPYVSCMVVLVGMLAQFAITLLRFLTRWSENRHLPKSKGVPENVLVGNNPFGGGPIKHLVGYGIPVVLALVFGGYLMSKAREPKPEAGQPDYQSFGKIPVMYQGRVKPLDTLARNTMRILSNRETFYDKEPLSFYKTLSARLSGEKVEQAKKIDAIVWLADLITNPDVANEHRIIRVDNDDVKNLLDLPRRKSHRYSYQEVFLQERKIQEEIKNAEGEPELREVEKINEEILREQADLARKVDDRKKSVFQRKVMELADKWSRIQGLRAAFVPPEIRPDDFESLLKGLRPAFAQLEFIDGFQPPLVIPADDKIDWEKAVGFWNSGPFIKFVAEEIDNSDLKWQTFSRAWLTEMLISLTGDETNRFQQGFTNVLIAYANIARDDVVEEGEEKPKTKAEKIEEFNEAVADYRKLLAEEKPQTEVTKDGTKYLDVAKVEFEHRFNSSSQFFYASWVYVMAFLLTAFGWLAAASGRMFTATVLQRSAMLVISITFMVHSDALWDRIYISGRPPVTNLYSSAVFIGWAAVLAAGVFEVFFKMGIGNAVAAIAGFGTLQIAHGLAGEGDTFTVLQAVLDTQFWLATHVVCITLGYAATFVAGLLGVIAVMRRNLYAVVLVPMTAGLLYQYVEAQSNATILGYYTLGFILAGSAAAALNWALPIASAKDDKAFNKSMSTMIYGTLCFALFFSFVGTVLGGLWADDSWGRFWGWDPKENGALIIVLWNALVLHARWDRMIGDRGLALLAIAGNITTSWSWFGVNELGVGLHSYGFTEGVLRNLALFVLANGALILAGAIVKNRMNQASSSNKMEVA